MKTKKEIKHELLLKFLTEAKQRTAPVLWPERLLKRIQIFIIKIKNNRMSTTSKTVTKEEALPIYQGASPETQAALKKLLGNDLLTELITDRITTFAAICKAVGVKEADFAFPAKGTPRRMLGICAERNALISEVFNEGHVFNPGDTIYYAYHQVIIDTTAPRGFRLAFNFYDFVFDYAILGARPGLKNKELAIFVGKTFIEEAENMYYWHLKAISKQSNR